MRRAGAVPAGPGAAATAARGRSWATAAAVAAALHAAPALAAGDCDGSLVTTSVFSRVLSDGAAATVAYHAEFQNQDPGRRRLVATVLPVQGGEAVGTPRPAQRLELGPYEQRDVAVLSVRVANPGGTGGPSTAEVGRMLRLECRFLP